jgi:hypothetical protein
VDRDLEVAAFRRKLGTLGGSVLVGYERMFATVDGTIDQVRERRREARRRELRSLCEQEARIKQRVTEIVREADDDGDWQAAGCSSSAQWLAQLSSSDHRSAALITRTSSALRSLPALDHALSTGALTLDQVAAAAEHATPETDAQLARIAVGKPPCDIALAARTLLPPTVTDDEELYQRRALSMTWTRGRSELAFSGRLPLEQGAAFEQAIWNLAKSQRALDKQAGTLLGWQQSAADALVTLARQGGAVAGGVKRSPTTLIVHLSDDEPPLLEGAGPLTPRQPSGSPATPAASRSSQAGATSCTHASGAAPPTPSSAHCASAQTTANTPAAPPAANSRHTTSSRSSVAAPPSSTTSSCSAPATTNCFTTTTSAPAAPPSNPPSRTKPDAPSPPTSHTHHRDKRTTRLELARW